MKKSSPNFNISRRRFLKTAGCLTVGFSMNNCWPATGKELLEEELPRSIKQQPKINAWIEILEDGRVQVLTGKMELGQGIRTAIAQVAAEELEMDLKFVTVHLAETGRTPHEGYTAGSGSIEHSAMSVRYAAASARQKLLQLAADKLKIAPDQLYLQNGAIKSRDNQVKLSYAEILEGKQIEDEVRLPVYLKPRGQYRLVGKSIPRSDIEKMVQGEPVYVQDLRFEDMVHARVIRPKGYKAELINIEEKLLNEQVPGVLKVVVDGSFLGVIAKEEYQAVKAQRFLSQNTRWSLKERLPQHLPLREYIKSLPTETENVIDKGKVSIETEEGEATIKASYFKPYIMHGSIGPSCAIALYDQEILHIWTHSQGVYPLRESLQKMLDMPEERLHVIGVPGSGCYGHNGADDVAADVALLALAYPGKHVRLQWSREDEHAWEPYGSAMEMELEASLDKTGKIKSWKYDLWSDSHSTRPGGDAANLLASRYLEKPYEMKSPGFKGGAYRNAEPYYEIPNEKIDFHHFIGPLRVSALRSLGAYANIFAIESFMDELAEKAQKDPVTFRLEHLKDNRAKDVVIKIRDLTKDHQKNENEGIGYAFSRYKNTAAYCAVAAKVLVEKDSGIVHLLHMWSSIDAGEVINIDGIKNQTEGGMVQAASWTLTEEVLFDAEHVTSREWNSYPIIRFSNIPTVEVAVLNQPFKKALGAGEAAQGPAAAAVANAIYNASGKRVRELPILPHKLKS